MRIKDGFYIVNLNSKTVKIAQPSELHKLFPKKEQIVVLKDNLYFYEMNGGPLSFHEAVDAARELAEKYINENM